MTLPDTPRYGNDELALRHTTAFLCSHALPHYMSHADVAHLMKSWAEALSPDEDCVVVGTLSQWERRMIELCVERRIPLILVLSECQYDDITQFVQRYNDFSLSEHMGAGRLLIVSTNDDPEDAGQTHINARRRNLWMLMEADRLMIGFLLDGGRLDGQLTELCCANYDMLHEWYQIRALRSTPPKPTPPAAPIMAKVRSLARRIVNFFERIS